MSRNQFILDNGVIRVVLIVILFLLVKKEINIIITLEIIGGIILFGLAANLVFKLIGKIISYINNKLKTKTNGNDRNEKTPN